jgi:cytochrome c oxidase subunit I
MLSLIVWGHHMFLTGMGTQISTFFQTTTMAVSIPSVIIVTCFLMTLWGGSIRLNTPMLFCLGFLPMFGIGGLSGLPLGFNFSGLHLHDSFYVIAHFHYIVAPGTLFALFAGVYYWFPKLTGRKLNEYLGKLHFLLSFLFMNLTFMPMFIQGFAGLNRRLADGGATYAAADGIVGLPGWVLMLHEYISHATWGLGLAQLPFIINLIYTLRRSKAVPDNPWQATTLEWQTSSPPPHANFAQPVNVRRGPYEYSVPETAADFLPQNK